MCTTKILKLCYVDTGIFIVCIKSENIYSNIQNIYGYYPNLQQIPDLSSRILTIRGFGSAKKMHYLI